MKTLRFGLAAVAAATARIGFMASSNGRAIVAPTPRRKWRRLRSQFCLMTFIQFLVLRSWFFVQLILIPLCVGHAKNEEPRTKNIHLAFLEEVGEDERFDDRRQLIVGFFALLR